MSAPRPLPRLRPCTRCGATSFHRVAPVREHGEDGRPVAMAVRYVEERRKLSVFAGAVSCVGPKIDLVPRGTFTVLICSSCGDTRWYARDVEAGSDHLSPATLGACADCGEARALCVPKMKTRGAGGQPSDLRILRLTTRRWGFSTKRACGHFSLFVCHGCARATFVALGLDDVTDVSAPTRPANPCRRCATSERLHVEPVDEDGATLRVFYDRVLHREQRIGRYAIEICTGCGLTDWTAHDMDALRPNAEVGVARIEAGAAAEGPYR